MTDEELEEIGIHYANNKNNKLLYFFKCKKSGNTVAIDIEKEDTLHDIIGSIKVQSYYDGIAFGKGLMARDTEIFLREYVSKKENMKRTE